jgi:hypothetical protein
MSRIDDVPESLPIVAGTVAPVLPMRLTDRPPMCPVGEGVASDA